jgi:Sulfotransferase domain
MHCGFLIKNLWDQRAQEKYGVRVRTTQYYSFHNQHIREIVPKERLLEFKAADGWEPLCEILGTEVPSGRYPHRNDSKAANQPIGSFAVYGMGIWIAVGICGWAMVWGICHMINK